jgi:hypothetical protein
MSSLVLPILPEDEISPNFRNLDFLATLSFLPLRPLREAIVSRGWRFAASNMYVAIF